MGKITIHRNSDWTNLDLKLGIFIDKKKLSSISFNKVQEYELSAGTHKLNTKIGGFITDSFRFELAENETKRIEISGYKYGHLISILSILILSIYFVVEYLFELKLQFILVLVGMGVLYHLYYLTFGKKNYIRISTVE